MEPSCAQSRNARGVLLQHLGRLEEAQMDLDAAVTLMHPPSAALFRNRAQVRRERGDHYGAVQVCRERWALEEVSEAPWRNCAGGVCGKLGESTFDAIWTVEMEMATAAGVGHCRVPLSLRKFCLCHCASYSYWLHPRWRRCCGSSSDSSATAALAAVAASDRRSSSDRSIEGAAEGAVARSKYFKTNTEPNEGVWAPLRFCLVSTLPPNMIME